MNKYKFLSALKDKLSALPHEDVNRSLDFYREMLDDRMEDGLSESAAVAAIGTPEDIAAQIINDYSAAQGKALKVKFKRKLKAYEIVLIAIGSPLWIALLAAAFACVIAVYAAVAAVLISLFVISIALFLGAFICLIGSALYITSGKAPEGILVIGIALFMAGISILVFLLATLATRGFISLNKLIFKKGG